MKAVVELVNRVDLEQMADLLSPNSPLIPELEQTKRLCKHLPTTIPLNDQNI